PLPRQPRLLQVPPLRRLPRPAHDLDRQGPEVRPAGMGESDLIISAGRRPARTAGVPPAHGPMKPKGWHSRGYLPHFDSPETVQFITFRLADSLPAHVAKALQDRDHALPRLERELDAGLGACWLKRTDIASMVEDALLHFDGK